MATRNGDSAEGSTATITDTVSNIPDVSAAVATSFAPLVTEQRRFHWRSSPRRRLRRKLDEALGQAPGDAKGILQSLIAECDLRAYDALRSSKLWGRTYYLLGVPAAVLATIAGAAGLASTAGRIPAAIIALVSAGLTTAASFLNSNENKQQGNKLSAAWQELADDVRLTAIQCGESLKDNPSKVSEAYYDLIRDVVRFNKRKSALLRDDLGPAPEPKHAQT